jgi:hypothetical protein
MRRAILSIPQIGTNAGFRPRFQSYGAKRRFNDCSDSDVKPAGYQVVGLLANSGRDLVGQIHTKASEHKLPARKPKRCSGANQSQRIRYGPGTSQPLFVSCRVSV